MASNRAVRHRTRTDAALEGALKELFEEGISTSRMSSEAMRAGVLFCLLAKEGPGARGEQQPLRREDDAKFYVTLRRRPDGSFRTSCRVQIDYPIAKIEHSVEKVFASEQEAWAFVQTQAGERGFDAVYEEHKLA